jgi:G3E family GTPase
MENPVTILTGFLGSGKTSLLNAVLEHHGAHRFAIVENEFGEQGVDGDLIMRPDEGIVEMNNGCLCCSLNEAFVDILAGLTSRKDEFEELIVESTGIADPAGIAAPFLAHPAVKREFTLRNVICVVDAEQVEDRLADTDEALRQIAFSNIIIINKTDLVHHDYVRRLREMLAEINPLARILSGCAGNYPFLDELLKGEPFAQDATIPAHQDHKHDHGHSHHHAHDHNHHHAHTDISTFTLTFDRPFSLPNLHFMLTQVLMFQSKGLYRIKGIVHVADEERPVVLQAVGNRLFIDSLAEGLHPLTDATSRVVVIGRGIKTRGHQAGT